MEYSKKSNKISEIVRLQQILKKWKKLANAPKNNNSKSSNSTATTTASGCTAATSSTTTGGGGGSKSIKFLKRTLSFSDNPPVGSSGEPVVRKGFLAVCVGKELKRFIIPTEYLSHPAFGILLREAEEEFGFQQEGVLKIPCEVGVFEKILKVVEEKREVVFLHDHDHDHHHHHDFGFGGDHNHMDMVGRCSPDCDLTPSHHPQMCR